VLKQPIGFVIDALAKIDSNVPFMMPERHRQDRSEHRHYRMIGSGPFRFIASEWVPGSKVVYEKFTDYVPRKEPASQAAGGKVVYVDRVESIYIPDHGVAMAALASGELDLHESPATDLLAMVESHPDVVTVPNDKLGWQLFMSLNHLHPAVRQQGGAAGGALGHQAGGLPGRHGGGRQALSGVRGDFCLRPAERVDGRASNRCSAAIPRRPRACCRRRARWARASP
jgi:hypothetical protein